MSAVYSEPVQPPTHHNNSPLISWLLGPLPAHYVVQAPSYVFSLPMACISRAIPAQGFSCLLHVCPGHCFGKVAQIYWSVCIQSLGADGGSVNRLNIKRICMPFVTAAKNAWLINQHSKYMLADKHLRNRHLWTLDRDKRSFIHIATSYIRLSVIQF